jgi:hypothetical protein
MNAHTTTEETRTARAMARYGLPPEGGIPTTDREVYVPLWAVILATLILWGGIFGAGYAVGHASTPAPTVGHSVSCQAPGGPACTRDSVLDPASNN